MGDGSMPETKQSKYHRGMVPWEKRKVKMKYEDFNPWNTMTDYVLITQGGDPADYELMVESAKELMREQIKCKIPFDFAKFIVITITNDDARRGRVIKWVYRPPDKRVIETILNCAAHRHAAKELERQERWNELKKFMEWTLQGTQLPSPPTLPQFPEESEWRKYVRSPLEVQMIKEQAKALRGYYEHKASKKNKKKG